MGMIIWEGVSQLDGVTPLVVIATGVPRAGGKKLSANRKTGDMIQTFILRADIDPMEALREGKDTAICGVCPHKSKASGGSGACYVTVFHAPLSTWRSWRNGNAERFDAERLRGQKIRFGSYGDPAAVPLAVWQGLAELAEGTTGYTHQWRGGTVGDLVIAPCDPGFAELMMASADNPAEGVAARRLGYRNFIVRAPGEPKPVGAVVCPASEEAGKRTVCASCLQCGGTGNGRRADITIEAHGATRGAFKSLPLMVSA